MKRFEFFTDIHLSGMTPRHRTDDFPSTMIGKLREVYATAKFLSCDFVAFGGDFFNSHRVFSYELIDDAIDIMEEHNLNTYCCMGEHDLYGHSPATYASSTLAHVVRRCPSLKIIQEPVDLGEVVLYAKHEWEPVEAIMGAGLDIDPSKYNILICHELITNQRAPFDVVSTSTFKGCPFDLVVSGDLHGGYSPHEVDGTWFCNPGSLARRSTADAHRWPQVAIIEVEKGMPPLIDIRRLECGKAGDEVLGLDVAEIAKQKEEFDGDGFAEEMLKFEAEFIDVHDLIQSVGKARGMRKDVLDYLSTKKPSEIELAGV